MIGDIIGKPGRVAIERSCPGCGTSGASTSSPPTARTWPAGWDSRSRSRARPVRRRRRCHHLRQPHLGQARDYPFLDASERVLRPMNYGTHDVPGRGWGVYHALDGNELAVINLQGRTYMQPIDNPFTDTDRLLDEASEPLPPIRLVDFHCEITSEKNALGLHLDGRVSVVVGTHTHVVTGDERILPGGTAYQTDLGMTGPLSERDRVRPQDRPAAVHQRPADTVRGGGGPGRASTPARSTWTRRPAGPSRSNGSSGWSRSEPVSDRHGAASEHASIVPGSGPTATADLHAHTTRSDGVLEPPELVRQAAAAGVRLLSITDHDNLAGYRELRASGFGAGARAGPGGRDQRGHARARARDPGWRAAHPRARGGRGRRGVRGRARLAACGATRAVRGDPGAAPRRGDRAWTRRSRRST